VDADAPRGAFAEVSKLGSCKRGAQVALKVKASYGGYTFGNVGRLCSAVDAKQIKLAWLHPAHELHDPSTMNVPRATIAKWLRDDHETMQLFGLRGVPGERHWKVERDVRRRTSLDSAGGHLGTGEPMLGKAEEGLMVSMADQAKRGTEEREAKVAAKKAKNEGRTRKFSLKWAPLVEKAEDILAGRAPTSAAELGAMLKVGELMALVVSRTGRTGGAKNNKAGAITAEAWAVLGRGKVPLAAAAAAPGNDSEEDDESEEEDEEDI